MCHTFQTRKRPPALAVSTLTRTSTMSGLQAAVHTTPVLRGRFYMVKARFSRKDLPDVKPCCWTPRCAGPAMCTGHTEAKARLDPPWVGGSQRGSHMSQSEVRIAAGRDHKASQFDKATALAEVSRLLCTRWWEGAPHPTSFTKHTTHSHTTRHTNANQSTQTTGWCPRVENCTRKHGTKEQSLAKGITCGSAQEAWDWKCQHTTATCPHAGHIDK